MSAPHPPFVRTRLSVMMFSEFFVWGSWGMAITGYADGLGFEGWQVGLLGAIPAVGAIISPLFVGLIADRYFAAQRILGVLHLLGAAALLLAGFQKSPAGLMTCMMLNGLFFMPTLALANSVAFTHIPNPDRFPRIALLGTIGWIAAVLLASVFLGGMKTPNFLFQAAVGGTLLSLYCMTLPHTPPKGVEAGKDAFGLGAMQMLKERPVLIFISCVFLIGIPACGYFFTLIGPMLQQRGYPAPLALTSLNQFAEIIFMFSMPWFVARLGLKSVVLIGMTAWAARYFCFTSVAFGAVLIGLILHGFCYSFFYVGAYMYVNKKAPPELKSSAQSLMTFLLIGVGWLIGGNAGGLMMEQHAPRVPNMAIVLDNEKDERALPRWDDPTLADSIWRYLDLSSTVSNLIHGEEEETAKPDLSALLDTDKNGTITLAEVRANIPDARVTIDEVEYSRSDIVAAFKKVAQQDAEDSIELDREAWLRAQSCDWAPIWLYPAIFISIVLGCFAMLFRDRAAGREPPS